jgi:hypothetical protein
MRSLLALLLFALGVIAAESNSDHIHAVGFIYNETNFHGDSTALSANSGVWDDEDLCIPILTGHDEE